MGAWYTIGLFLGLGTALGVAFVAVVPRALLVFVPAAVVAAVLGYVFSGAAQAAAGAIGGTLGAFGSEPVVTGTLRRGGTRGGTATILILAALVLAGLAFVPALGYVEVIAVPVFGLRLRRRAPDRHAGLRTLAKD